MDETTRRMIEPNSPPDEGQLKAWLGREAHGYWQKVAGMINHKYPEVFTPEWLFGGKKHGWGLRYKKSKSFCTLIPEQGRFLIQIVFGKDERAKVENSKTELSEITCRAYDEATTYHDGKWLLLKVDNKETLADVERLLAVKRKPRQIQRVQPNI